MYRRVLQAIARQRDTLRVVLIGANDGQTNDPFFEAYGKGNQGGLDITLVEPLSDFNEILEEAYSGAHSVRVLNSLVGTPGSTSLFVIRKEYWKTFQPPYATGWPIYRAPTGISSVSYGQVAAWVAEYFPQIEDPGTYIDRVEVEAKTLKELFEREGIDHPIDVLQVDAEGADGQVLENCSLEEIRPSIIFFESKSLESDERRSLEALLGNLGYFQVELGGDTLCISGDRFVLDSDG